MARRPMKRMLPWLFWASGVAPKSQGNASTVAAKGPAIKALRGSRRAGSCASRTSRYIGLIDPSPSTRARHEQRYPEHPPDARIPGRGRRAAAPDGARRLLRERHLPARADLQRVGCLRQAALRGDRQAGAARRRRTAPHPPDAGRRGGHADGQRYRHRHGPPGADRQPRHHRALGHASLHEPSRRGQGRHRAHRPVRRRLLFRLHGRGPDRGDEPPGGVERGMGVALVGQRRLRGGSRQQGAGRPRAPRHRGRAPPEA